LTDGPQDGLWPGRVGRDLLQSVDYIVAERASEPPDGAAVHTRGIDVQDASAHSKAT